MKKIILGIFFSLSLVPTYLYTESGGHHPSVEEVFGGLTEEQIAEQVKEGQKFLEELEKNGTPEEKAEFERLLMETLNSMSEQDFNDITNIAKMVEPHLDIPVEEPKMEQAIPKAEAKPERMMIEGSLVETFQNFIGSITECLDQLLQKMQNSKSCSEEVDMKWRSKTTFNNMKRQIYQLKTNRLAQKLSKKDLSPDEEELVKLLKQFLADISAQNDDFKIEDNFGLPTTIELENKYLKKTKAILSTFDNYIDILMPTLEKFLRKWDPEALEMSKEADIRATSVLNNATESAKFVPQKAALPTTTERRSSSNMGGAGYPGSGYGQAGYYPEEQGGYYNPNNASAFNNEPENRPAPKSSTKEANKPTPKTPETKNIEKASLSPYDYATNELAEYTHDLFDSQHEQKFVDFLKGITTSYPIASQTATTPPTTTIRNEVDQTNWLENDFKNYTARTKQTFKSDFMPEFEQLTDVIGTVKKKIVDMSSDELQKLQDNTDLLKLEARIARYKAEFDPIEESLHAAKLRNTTSQQSTATSNNGIFKEKGPEYSKAHNDFVTYLHDKIGDQLSSFAMDIENLKRKAKRTAGSLRTKETKKQSKATIPTEATIQPVS